MRCSRPVIAADVQLFGRKPAPAAAAEPARALLSADDVRLFLTTFAAGFAFVAFFIA